jgi:O-antigen biosynthesis protein
MRSFDSRDAMQKFDLPIVSIVIPCFNQSKYAYESVLSAKLAYGGRTEIILVNDGSTEAGISRKLKEVVELLSDDRCHIRVIEQENRGLPGARNVGVQQANGEFIQLLDCDDLLVAGKIDYQVKHFSVTSDIDVSITDCLYANEVLDQFERHEGLMADFDYSLEDFSFHWERGFSIPIHCALFRKRVFSKVSFNTTVKAKEDWIFWTTLVSEGGQIAYSGQCGAIYRVHEQSMCRAMRNLKNEWLRAAAEIDPIVSKRFPNFLPAAISWGEKAYRQSENHVSDHSSNEVNSNEESPHYDISPIWATCHVRAVGSRWSPRISVIVPIFNHFQYIRLCIKSLSSQQSDDIEVILIDDASTDERVRDLLMCIPTVSDRIKVIYNKENCGIVETQNRAVLEARGEYVGFLDCDDYLSSDALSRALRFIDENGGCDYFFSNYMEIDSQGSPVRVVRYGGYSDDRFIGDFRYDILNGMVASHLKIVRRASIQKVGGFDPSFSGAQDWELALKIAEFGKFVHLPEVLYYHRVHPESTSVKDARLMFHLTNVLRRIFAPRLLNVRQQRLGRNMTRTIIDGSRPIDVRELTKAWMRGPVVLDATRSLSRSDLWRVREFNSYIDEILWSSSEIYAALLGFVWSPDILTRIVQNDAIEAGAAVHE